MLLMRLNIGCFRTFSTVTRAKQWPWQPDTLVGNQAARFNVVCLDSRDISRDIFFIVKVFKVSIVKINPTFLSTLLFVLCELFLICKIVSFIKLPVALSFWCEMSHITKVIRNVGAFSTDLYTINIIYLLVFWDESCFVVDDV